MVGVAINANGTFFGSGQDYTGKPNLWSLLTASSPNVQSILTNWEVVSGNSSAGMGGLAVDANDNVYLADAGSNKIVKFNTKQATWTVLAGSGALGSVDGQGSSATFNLTTAGDMPIDAAGNLYLSTVNSGTGGYSIRKITPAGVVTTLFTGLTSVNSNALAIDAAGNLYATGNGTLYRFTPTGAITSYLTQISATAIVSSMVTDAAGNLFLNAYGTGAQIFKVHLNN